MEFAWELTVKYLFWAMYGVTLFSLVTKFPQPLNLKLLEKLAPAGGRSLTFFAIFIVTTFVVMTAALLGVLFLFFILGAGMKLFYVGMVTVWMFRFVQITGIWRSLAIRFQVPLTMILAVGLASIWAVWPNWVTYDLTALICGYVILSALTGFTKINYWMALLAAFMIYDSVGVMYAVGNANQGAMVQLVFSQGFLPIGLISTPFGGEIGLADFVLPGMIVALARSYGLVIWSVVGWCLGLFVLLLFAAWLRTALPATIFLVPFTLFAFLLAANRKKVAISWM